MCGFSWRGRRFKFLFVHCFLLWCLILSSGKKHFVREIFCKMQNTDSPEQVRWYTWNVRMSISSKQCCLFPESVGIYLEYMKQRKGCFKWSKPEGIFLWFLFVMKSTQRTWESPGGCSSSEVLALKMGSAVSIQGPECALSNLVLLSHCFYSELGCSAAWMGQRRALGSSGQHLLPSPVERLLRV